MQTLDVTHRYSLVLGDESRHIGQRSNPIAKAMLQDMKRKLVAILAGDVAGYSRLVGQDEEQTIQNWTACRDYICDVAGDYQGRLFNTAGDSLVFEFASVLDALRCAVEVQHFLRDVNTDVPAERRLQMRFGLHLGDVVVDKGNFLGNRVNVAARLEAQADPGGICVSEIVYSNVANSSEFAFEDLGEREMKNIARPMRVYRVLLNGGGPSPAPPPAIAPPNAETGDQAAVAVLPFDNMGGDPEDEYFVDGLTEDIITALAAWRSFPVIARNSTFAYKGKSPDVRSVAGDLGARYVLEGSIRKGDGRVRVNAQLIDAATGHHIWAEKFDREIEDVFAVQDEITHHIAATIAPELEKAERDRVTAVRPKDLTAWGYCLRGRSLLEEFTPSGNAQAREMFEKAIALDPTYSGAHVGLAYSYHRDLWFGTEPAREPAIEALLAAARRAVVLDRANSEAHCLLGFGLIWDRHFDLAIAAGQQAIQLNPSNAIAHAQLGMALSFSGRPVDGIGHLEHSLRLNPQDPRIHFVLAMLARAHLNARDAEAAARWAETTVHRRSDYPLAHLVLAAACGHLGRRGEAGAALAECERLDPGFATRWALRPMYKDPADDLYFLDGVRRAGLEAEASFA